MCCDWPSSLGITFHINHLIVNHYHTVPKIRAQENGKKFKQEQGSSHCLVQMRNLILLPASEHGSLTNENSTPSLSSASDQVIRALTAGLMSSYFLSVQAVLVPALTASHTTLPEISVYTPSLLQVGFSYHI